MPNELSFSRSVQGCNLVGRCIRIPGNTGSLVMSAFKGTATAERVHEALVTRTFRETSLNRSWSLTTTDFQRKPSSPAADLSLMSNPVYGCW